MPRATQSTSSKRAKSASSASGRKTAQNKTASTKTAQGKTLVKPNGNGSPKTAQKAYVVRWSKIHGRGVFAATAIRKGTRIIEYKGKRISYKLACKLYPDVEGKPTHTFLFEIDDDTVIDAAQGGNAARWINHSCEPNCEAVDDDGRIYIEAIRNIKAGEELGYNYGITLDERHTPAEKKRWPCYCGKKKCRGTLLMPKR
jgi:SET domain-containing protein